MSNRIELRDTWLLETAASHRCTAARVIANTALNSVRTDFTNADDAAAFAESVRAEGYKARVREFSVWTSIRTVEQMLFLARAGKLPCPDCDASGPHNDNGCKAIANLTFCCCACGMHFDAETVSL